MFSRLSHHLKPLAASLVLLGTVAVLVGPNTMPIAASVACACGGGGEEGEVGGSPASFGTVTVGNSLEKVIEVTNEALFTSTVIRQEMIPFVGNGFTINSGSSKDTCKGSIGPFVSCKAPVIFKPTEKRKYESELETELEMQIFPNKRYHGALAVTGQGG